MAVDTSNNNNQNANNNNTEIDIDTGIELIGTVEIPKVHFSANRELLIMTTLKAPSIPKERKRAPVEIMGVIDRSGSMAGEKLELVKKTLLFVVEQMQDDDKFGIVTFDDTVRTDHPLTFMTRTNKDVITSKIKSLCTGGSTNLCGGLVSGVDEIRRKKNGKNMASVLLFTDGMANVGHRDAEPIMKAVLANDMGTTTSSSSSYGWIAANVLLLGLPSLYHYYVRGSGVANGSLPCTINTFGFGGDHDSRVLNEISRKSDGLYFYVKNAEEIPKAFGNCLGGLVSVVAQKMELTVETLHGAKITKTFTKFTEQINSARTKSVLKISDLQAEEQKNILFKLKLPPAAQPSDNVQLAKVTLTYYNALTNQQETQSMVIQIDRPSEVSEKESVRNFQIDIEHNRVKAASAMEKAAELGNQGQLEKARSVLEKCIKHIESSLSAKDSKNVGLVKDLKDSLKHLNSQRTFNDIGKQVMMTNCSSHWTERQTDMAYGGQERYKTSARVSMVSKFS